jgi:integrase
MPKRRFTQVTFDNLKPRGTRYEYPVGAGLYVSVQPSGNKRYVGRYQSPVTSKNSKYTFAAGLELAAVNTLWAEFKYALSKKRDPAIEKKAEAEAAAQNAASEAVTLGSVIARYYRDPRIKGLRSAAHSESMLRRNVSKELGARPINSLRRSELITLQDELAVARGARTADATLHNLNVVFNWYALRDPTEEFRNPIVRGMFAYRAHQHRRKRILSDDEIRAFWKATAAPTVYNKLCRFLLLTAARRNEAAQMTWDELSPEGNIWTLPARRNKTGEELQRPLSALAQSILAQCPRIEGNPHVFSLEAKAFNSHSRFKAQLDAELKFSEQWQVHDIRRSARSLLSRCDVASDIAEMCLGHVLPQIRATYDLHKYIEPKRHAFEALASLIGRIVDPPPSNVAEFSKRKRKVA